MFWFWVYTKSFALITKDFWDFAEECTITRKKTIMYLKTDYTKFEEALEKAISKLTPRQQKLYHAYSNRTSWDRTFLRVKGDRPSTTRIIQELLLIKNECERNFFINFQKFAYVYSGILKGRVKRFTINEGIVQVFGKDGTSFEVALCASNIKGSISWDPTKAGVYYEAGQEIEVELEIKNPFEEVKCRGLTQGSFNEKYWSSINFSKPAQIDYSDSQGYTAVADTKRVG